MHKNIQTLMLQEILCLVHVHPKYHRLILKTHLSKIQN